jgi:hypothetical protein
MRRRQTGFALGGALLLAACGLGDVFASPGIGDVTLVYAGPTVMSVNDRAAVAVSVTVAGGTIPNPRVFIESSDKTVLAVSAAGDSLIALSRGFDTLTIRYVGSIFTDSFPTLRQQVRVLP